MPQGGGGAGPLRLLCGPRVLNRLGDKCLFPLSHLASHPAMLSPQLYPTTCMYSLPPVSMTSLLLPS